MPLLLLEWPKIKGLGAHTALSVPMECPERHEVLSDHRVVRELVHMARLDS